MNSSLDDLLNYLSFLHEASVCAWSTYRFMSGELVGRLRSSCRRTLKPLRSDHTFQTNEIFTNSPSLEICGNDRLSFHWKQQKIISTYIAEFCDSGDGNMVRFTGFHDWHWLSVLSTNCCASVSPIRNGTQYYQL